MRIIRDVDGDIWEEVAPDSFNIRTGGYNFEEQSLAHVEVRYGPVEVYGSKPKRQADTSVYRVTYRYKPTSHVSRRGLATILGSRYSEKPVKVERAPEIEWLDVTAEFLRESE